MSRWRNSLTLLGHMRTSKAKVSGSRSTLLPVIPDFLAPSLQYGNGHARRHAASVARVAFAQSALESTQDNTGASSSSHGWRQKEIQSSTNDVDFTHYFDADFPEASSSASMKVLPSATRCTPNEAFDSIKARLNSATNGADLSRTAQSILNSSALRKERRSVNAQHAPTAPILTIELNQHFILSLVRASCSISDRSGNADSHLMDQLVSKYLRSLHRSVSSTCFSDGFLRRLAWKLGEAGSHSADKTLSLVLDIVQERLAHQAAASTDASAQQSDSMALRGKTSARQQSRILLRLMQSFSAAGRSDSVTRCFNLIQQYNLPASILHYQFAIIALFRQRTSQLAHKDQADVERESHDLEASILQIKTLMENDGISIDDTFLATVVAGLSAPLRNPLAAVSSVVVAKGALELVRSILGRFPDKAGGRDGMPRLVSAWARAEIDAVERQGPVVGNAKASPARRIGLLIEQLESKQSDSPIVGLLGDEPITEAQLASVYLRLRLCAALDHVDQSLDHLRLLLSVEPMESSPSKTQELILKQRSAAVRLFSTVMQRRHGIAGQDAAFEVMRRCFSAVWFDRIWSGVVLPSNLTSHQEREDYDGEATVLRIWTRWIHAWSADYWAEGGSLRDGKYRTFTGSYPWQTLKRGLQLLNKTLDQYDSALTPSTTRISAYASLFTQRNVLDNIVKMCLRGGRPAPNESIATHVHRRLDLLIRTLTRVNVPARTWHHVESSLLRHLALIDREALPTAAVRPSMETVKQRKQHALMRRDQELRKAWSEPMDAPETGSIFVLRQMLKQQELQRKLKEDFKPMFT